MDDNKVEFIANTRKTDVAAAITVAEPVAICHRTLVLHSCVRDRDEFVAVFVPGIFAKPIFKGLEHPRDFLELFHCRRLLMGKHPVAHIQRPAKARVFLRPGNILANICVDAVVIYRVDDLPVKGLCLVLNVVIHPFQTAVRDRREAVGNRDVYLHSPIGLVISNILIRPPYTCPDALTCGGDVVIAEIVASPGHAAAPGRVCARSGPALVCDLHPCLGTGLQFIRKIDPVNIAFAFELQRFGAE